MGGIIPPFSPPTHFEKETKASQDHILRSVSLFNFRLALPIAIGLAFILMLRHAMRTTYFSGVLD